MNQDDESSPVESEILVYTVNHPLEYFAKRIGGDQVEVVFPAPIDVDPAFWNPDAETISGYQKADLILLNGASYAKWVPAVTLPRSKLVDTTKAVSDQLIQVKDAAVHQHGSGQEHAHGAAAFTTWLDPEIALEQSRAICDALKAFRPDRSAEFDEAFRLLEQDFAVLSDSFANAVASLEGDAVIFSHPVYQYFQHRFAVNGNSVHWEPDAFPSEEQWDDLEALIESNHPKWMIWEGEPLEKTVDRLSELGIRSVVFAPCANRIGSGDWLTVMTRNAETLSAAFHQKGDSL